MHLSPILLLVAVFLGIFSTGGAQDCSRCDYVQNLVARFLNSYREDPAIYPSLAIDQIEAHIGDEESTTDLDISFSRVEVIGIPDFEIDKNEFTLIDGDDTPGILNLTIKFPQLILTGANYKFTGIIAGALPLHSDGPFEIILTDVTLKAWGLFFLRQLRVSDVVADVSAEDLKVDMVNILGDLSDALNAMLTDIGLEILGELKPGINKFVAKYLEKLLNKLLPGGGSNGDEAEFKQMTQEFFENAFESILGEINSRRLN